MVYVRVEAGLTG